MHTRTKARTERERERKRRRKSEVYHVKIIAKVECDVAVSEFLGSAAWRNCVQQPNLSHKEGTENLDQRI